MYPLSINDVGFFYIYNSGENRLWRTDGTESGTYELTNAPFYTSIITILNGELILWFNNYFDQYDLWKSDGTNAGTMLYKNIQFDSEPYFHTINDNIFFKGDGGIHGSELMKSDGTAEGTIIVKDIYPGNTGSDLKNMVVINNKLYLSANDGVNGHELWKSDLTTEGTIMLKDMNVGSADSNPNNFTDINGSVFFTADDGEHGTELWVLKSGVGIDQVGENGCKSSVYPNPAHDQLFVDLANSKNATVELSSVEGRLLQKVQSYGSKVSMDISNIKNGTYFVKVMSPEGISVRKIIKE